MAITVDEARDLMHEWTESPALRIHMECVGTCMGAYADRLAPEERERWVIAGLLHDYDYERHPSEIDHPYKGVCHLRERGDTDEEIIEAILGHADYTGVPRQTNMARALFAVDELAGFIVACVKVRPNGIADLTPRSVKKKLKDKKFAAGVNRDDVRVGISELDVDPTEHIQTCIDVLRADAERLGLLGAHPTRS